MSNPDVVPVAATLYWANLDKTNEFSGKYQVDLACLSDKAVSALEGMGIAINNKGDDRGNFVTVKSKNTIIPKFNCDPVAPSSIGNGSTATAAVSFYDWEFKGKKGRSPSLKKLLINEVALYGGGGDDDDLDLTSAL